MLSRTDLDQMIVKAKFEVQQVMEEFVGGFEDGQDLYGGGQQPELGRPGGGTGRFSSPIEDVEQVGEGIESGDGTDNTEWADR
jgi:hypothetical protein